MSLKRIQVDTPYTGAVYGVLPKEVPGRVPTDDFVFFNYPSYMKPGDYNVVVESLDTSNITKFRNIGPLNKMVELPHVHYDAYATIAVIPRLNQNLPRFNARLNRGSTYSIPEVAGAHKTGMVHPMHRHGVLTAGAGF